MDGTCSSCFKYYVTTGESGICLADFSPRNPDHAACDSMEELPDYSALENSFLRAAQALGRFKDSLGEGDAI